MTNLGAQILNDIIYPDQRGIGAGIEQTKTPVKATNTVQKAASKTNTSGYDLNMLVYNGGWGSAIGQGMNDTKTTSSGNMQRVAQSPLPAERLDKEIFGNKANYVSTLVDEMLDATVNKRIREEIRKGQLSLASSKIGTTYAKALAYYKKLYDGSIIMTELRNKTEKNISNLINQRINDRIFAWEKKLPGWQRMLLAKSKLMSSLTANVNAEVKKAIGSIITDTAIKGINDNIIANLKSIRNSINTTIVTKFKDQIAYALKLRSAIQDKIKAFMELKRKYEERIFTAIQNFKTKIAEAISAFTQKMVSTLTDSIKSAVSSSVKTGVAKA